MEMKYTPADRARGIYRIVNVNNLSIISFKEDYCEDVEWQYLYCSIKQI